MNLLIIPLVTACISSGIAVHTDCCQANDNRIVYEGRTIVGKDAVVVDWSNTVVRVSFTGSTLSMTCNGKGKVYFNVWIDREQSPVHDRVIHIEGEQNVVVAGNLEKGRHSVILQKRSEGEQGYLEVKGFETDGRITQASDPHKRHIEFIGDSYTCGYGTEASDRDQPFRAEEENCNLTYAAIAGRYFDAGVRTICHSGRGIVRNYDDGCPGETMVKKYAQALDEYSKDTEWYASKDSYRPDIVVIYLGTNDFSTGKQPIPESWCAEYARLLGLIRSNYGESVPVLCVASKAGSLMGEYVREAVEKSGLTNVFWTDIQSAAHNDVSDLGASWHPNYAGHRKVACCIIPYISTITGWDMPIKAIE